MTEITDEMLDAIEAVKGKRNPALWDPRCKQYMSCLLYTSPSPRDRTRSRMPSSA